MRTPPPTKVPNVPDGGLLDFLRQLKESFYVTWSTIGNLQSREVIIDDDSISSFTPPQSGGFLFITTNLDNPQEAMSGCIYYDVGSTLKCTKQFGGANLLTSESDVTGTTGADGNVTVAVQPGVVKVENRSGSNCAFRLPFL